MIKQILLRQTRSPRFFGLTGDNHFVTVATRDRTSDQMELLQSEVQSAAQRPPLRVSRPDSARQHKTSPCHRHLDKEFAQARPSAWNGSSVRDIRFA